MSTKIDNLNGYLKSSLVVNRTREVGKRYSVYNKFAVVGISTHNTVGDKTAPLYKGTIHV
jgi:hypothetical protein